MIIRENYSLKELNTFGIDISSRYFTEVSSVSGFQSLFKDPDFLNIPQLILGGGSNILFTKNFDGIVIKNNIKGIEKLREDETHIYVKAGAGEVWHEFVLYCIENSFAGVENLSLIPGSVGAGPMQNIGAYGIELKEVFFELEALHIKSGELRTFNKEACNFGYRNSVFKNEVKNQYVIVSVTFKLDKNPSFNTSYGAIETELKAMNVSTLSLKAVSQAVCNIRRSKLPDPAIIGNAGSFFKNPEVALSQFDELKKSFPSIVGYPVKNGNIKLAAGWLIEQCGWKGKQIENYGVHKNQALVLVNYGGAEGNSIFQLSKDIRSSVKETFNVELEIEVNIA